MRTVRVHEVDRLTGRAAGAGSGWPVSSGRTRCRRRAAAFTLVEVILAITIAVGILVVALHFYSQAVDLRSRLLEESDRISSVRLLLDRLTVDLRGAYAQPQVGFTGDAASLRFVMAVAPNRGGWDMRNYSRTTTGAIETDLTVVQYGAAQVLEGTNRVMTGLTRTEHSLLELPSALPVVTNRTAGGPVGVGLGGGLGGGVDKGPAAADPRVPVFDEVRFVQFSFWDGHGWTERWDASSPPGCVEVVLGVEPLPEGVDPLDYPYEIFRRVIYVPGSRPALSGTDPLAAAFE